MNKATRIHILTTNNHPNSFAFVFPILANRKRLSDMGLEFSFFYSLANRKTLFDCDIIFVDNKFFKFWWQRHEAKIYEFLTVAKNSAGRLLWFDTADSTGTPQFRVLPYVEGYYKNQVLKEKRLYYNNYYRSRIFSDYYHKRFGIIDDTETGCEYPLDPAYTDKIHISWNSGLNDYGLYAGNYSLPGNIISKTRKFYPFNTDYTSEFINALKPRPLPITARLSLRHTRNFVIYHRRLLIERLNKFGVKTNFTNRMFYYNELRNAKLSISPFGMGEVCYRDFETVINGALLVKPDMDHIETWPDIYKDGITYVKCDWDFSDIEEKIEWLLSNPEKIINIALSAQKNYYYYLYGKGREGFCDRVSGIIGRHINSGAKEYAPSH